MSSEKQGGSGASPLSRPAHTLSFEAVIEELDTLVEEGLSPDEANRRLQEYGQNKLDEDKGISVVKILVRQVANAMMLVKISTCFAVVPFVCTLRV